MWCCRKDGAGIGADREEAGNADIENAGEAPVHIETERHERVDAAHGQQRDAIEEKAVELVWRHQNTLPPNRPCGLKINRTTMMAKAMPVL